jgi:HSP20 family molecular chaperone IbpA
MSHPNISHFLHNIRFLIRNLQSTTQFSTKRRSHSSIELQTFSRTSIPISDKMSPFSNLNLAAGGTGYGNGIDRDFSPILNYIDEFDRHFSGRHRFVNCFIPRFDLEEDAHNYYLYGDIPGANVNDITVEAHDNHTLVIYGKTVRPGPDRRGDGEEVNAREDQEFVKVMVEDHEHVQHPDHKTSAPAPSGDDQEAVTVSTQAAPAPSTAVPSFPPPPTQAEHPHHQRHSSVAQGQQRQHSDHRILLSERLVGDFHRTFAFPQPVVEEGVKASMENGILSLVVPKREKGQEPKRGRTVPILHGNWWKGQEKGSGFGFASGAV